MQGLYVHIPFCDRICRYCDFAKVATDVVDHMRYLHALETEYALYKAKQEFCFDTVYFGGGTPSALCEEALEYLLKIFETEIKNAKEITFEANPESLTEEKILLLKKYGVNRVSLGVQTFNEKQLKFLNRLHTVDEVYACFALLKKHGIDNINLDFIYALHGQTLDDLIVDIEHIKELEPTHIATYALIFEPHTALFLQMKANKVQEADDETQEQMYRLINEQLQAMGYGQYEFSNWSKSPELLSQHNTKYWNLSEYLGIGLGSHGFLKDERYANTRSIVKYLELLEAEQLPVVEIEKETEQALMEEMVFLGLRMTVGIEKSGFYNRFNQDIFTVFGKVLDEHIRKGNIIETDTHLRLSEDALFISNSILSDFLLDD